MQSPLKRILVYDLETGGLSSTYNSITELAGIAIDLETLTIIDEFSVMIKPHLDLSYVTREFKKEAKILFNNLATKDEETNIKTLTYKGQRVTLKNLEVIADDIEKFRDDILEDNSWFTHNDVLEYKGTEYEDIMNLYLEHTYQPTALEITHVSLEMLLTEGVEYGEAYKQISSLIKKHTVGNSKPIIAGHNIRRFDNAFMEKLFIHNKDEFSKQINPIMIDSLDWAHLRWFELPNFTLGTCANELGLTLKEAHRALPDTIANAKFLIKLLQSLRGEGSQKSKYVRRKFALNF